MKYLQIIICFLMVSTTCFGQTKFDFDSNTVAEKVVDGKYDIVQQMNGVELRVSNYGSGAEFTQITDFGDLYGSEGNLVSIANNKNTALFTFSEPVLIVRLNAINLGGDGGYHTIKDPSGTYTDIDTYVTPSRSIEVMWNNITSFEISVDIGSTPGWDNIIFVPVSGLVTGTTYVPDDNFEQALIDQGYDDTLDNYVDTYNIAYEDLLYIYNESITDLTGINNFKYLKFLNIKNNPLITFDITELNYLEDFNCSNSNLTSLDLSGNPNLEFLFCTDNLLETIDFSHNPNFRKLVAERNKFSTLDFTLNPKLFLLKVDDNDLTSLDLSTNLELTYIAVQNNALTYLDISNGENEKLTTFDATGNTGLSCIIVDNATYMEANWESAIDELLVYKEACTLAVDTPLTQPIPDYFSINDGYITPTTKNIILKVFDSKGSEMSSNINLHGFYIVIGYDKTNSKRYSTKVVLQ